MQGPKRIPQRENRVVFALLGTVNPAILPTVTAVRIDIGAGTDPGMIKPRIENPFRNLVRRGHFDRLETFLPTVGSLCRHLVEIPAGNLRLGIAAGSAAVHRRNAHLDQYRTTSGIAEPEPGLHTRSRNGIAGNTAPAGEQFRLERPGKHGIEINGLILGPAASPFHPFDLGRTEHAEFQIEIFVKLKRVGKIDHDGCRIRCRKSVAVHTRAHGSRQFGPDSVIIEYDRIVAGRSTLPLVRKAGAVTGYGILTPVQGDIPHDRHQQNIAVIPDPGPAEVGVRDPMMTESE